MAEPVPLDGTGGDDGAAPASSGFTFSTIASVFPPTDDADLQLDRWRKARVFVSAFLAEPALNVVNGCDMLDVEVLARALIAGVPSEFWLDYLDCVQGVVFVWQFLLLMSDQMDASPALSRAVGELLFFACHTDAQGLVLLEAKAGEDAKAFKQEWAEASVERHEAWLMSQGVRDTDMHVVAVGPSTVRIIEQSNELRFGQVWPGRKAARAFLEDYTAERQRKKADDKRAADQAGGKRAARGAARAGTRPARRRSARRGMRMTAVTTSLITSCGRPGFSRLCADVDTTSASSYCGGRRARLTSCRRWRNGLLSSLESFILTPLVKHSATRFAVCRNFCTSP